MDGEPLRADAVSKQFARALKAAGSRPMRLYDARHTCATLLVESGESLKMAAEILGHSTIAITANIYSHVRPETAYRAMARLAAFVDSGGAAEDGTDKTRTVAQ
jgi:integrase